MTSTLLVIDANTRTERQIASGCEAELTSCDGGKAGLNACCAIEPDGVVIGSTLKDSDPVWLLESIRSQPTRAGNAVLIALVDDDDEAMLARLYGAGADVCLKRPKRAPVLVAAIEAALALGARVRTDSTLPSGTPRGGSSVPASGQIEDGIAMITMRQLEAGRRSGELQFVGFSGKTLIVEFASGVLTGGRIGKRSLDNAAALREALHWEEGRFDFVKKANVLGSAVAAQRRDALRIARSRATQARSCVRHVTPGAPVDAAGAPNHFPRARRRRRDHRGGESAAFPSQEAVMSGPADQETQAPDAERRRMRIATRCTSLEDFVWTFSKYVDDRSIFISTRVPKPVGTLRPFALLLEDRQTVVMEGLGEVIECIEPAAADAAPAAPDPPVGVGGMRLRMVQLDERSRGVFDQLLESRAAAQAEPVATVPPPPAPEPPPRLLLVAQRFEDLTDDALAAFLECTLFEERGSLPSLTSSPEFSLARHSGEVRVLPVLVNDPAPIPPLVPPPEMTEQGAAPAPVFGPAPAPRPAQPREPEIASPQPEPTPASPVAPPPSPPPASPVAPPPSPPPASPTPPPHAPSVTGKPSPAPARPPELAPPRAPKPLPPLVPPRRDVTKPVVRAIIFGLLAGLIGSVIVIVWRGAKRTSGQTEEVVASQPPAKPNPTERPTDQPARSSPLASASASSAAQTNVDDCVITVGSSPQRAKVTWNGREIGTTPLLDAKIPCGIGKLTVAVDSYETAEEELEATQAKTLRAFKRLVPSPPGR